MNRPLKIGVDPGLFMPKLRIPRSTQIPDEIFDQYMAELSGAEFKVLLYIARRTFGFRKKADAISLTQICEGITRKNGERLDRGTGLSRSTVVDCLRRLAGEYGLIVTEKSVVEGSRESDVNTYRLDLDEDAEVVRKSNHVEVIGGTEIELPGSPKIEPTTYSYTTYRKNTPIVPSQENQTPIDEETGEEIQTIRQHRRVGSKRRERPVDPNSTTEVLRRMRENGAAGRQDAAISTSATGSGTPLPPIEPTAPGRDYVALWRQIVTSAPPVWSEQHDGHLLRAARGDTEFTENWEDLYRKAEQINRNAEEPWMTIQTFFSVSSKNHQKHYHRIFTGQYNRWLKTAPARKPGSVAEALLATEKQRDRQGNQSPGNSLKA